MTQHRLQYTQRHVQRNMWPTETSKHDWEHPDVL